MLQDDKQFFDNTDNDFEQDEDLESSEPLPANESDDDGEEEPKRKGNPAIALRQERESNRQLKQQFEQQQQKLASLEAMFEQLNQRGYAPQQQQQPDPRLLDQQRQQFADQLLERPDEVFNNFAQQIQRQTYASQAPLMVDRVFSEAVKGDEELTSALNVPVVREILAPYVQDELSRHGNMGEAVKMLKPLIQQTLAIGKAFSQQAKPAQKVAPDRADSFAGKQTNPSKQGFNAEQIADTLRGMTGEQRRAYMHMRHLQEKR
jgi:hypothetical protein